MTYEGWKNYQTWNVSLWINNDYGLYIAACEFMKKNANSRNPYRMFIKAEGLEGLTTPDKIKWNGTKLAYSELNEMMQEFIPNE